MVSMHTQKASECLGRRANYLDKVAGHEDTYTAAAKIQNTLFSIDRQGSGDDLRQWTPKARRALRAAGNIHCMTERGNGSIEVFLVPKLALLVASPVLRDCIAAEPDLNEIHFADPKFTPASVAIICYWLTSICSWSSQAVPHLPYPKDLFLALQLRHAARLLGMHQYIESFDVQYCRTIPCRVPCLDEAIAIGKYTSGNDDLVLNAWASRMAHLRYNGNAACKQLAILDHGLDAHELEKLITALDHAQANFDTHHFQHPQPVVTVNSRLLRHSPASVCYRVLPIQVYY